MAKLFLVRHGKSEWNKLGQWTGWTDVDLVEEGEKEARKAGEFLKEEI
jgi:2,3-bisphosphoglycerate-dependent phosphoglycerate mutase